jgi:Zn finger protein HypA/HybF involved in hydrogenase expression
LSVSRGIVLLNRTLAPHGEQPRRDCKRRTEDKEMTVETYKGDAYCVKCKEKRDFEGTVKVSDSGRRMAQGICPVCGTKVNRILGKAQ